MTSDFDHVRELAKDFATELRRKNRSQRTIDGYLQHIEYFATYLEAEDLPTSGPDITRNHIGGYIESLLTRKNLRTGEPLSPEYARGQYRSLQQFFKYLHAEEIVAVNPFDRMTVPDAPEQEVPVPSLDALKALLSECSGTSFDDRRDTAIIRMFLDTGCRRGEIAPLQIDSLDFAENTVTVLGKGRRPRTIPFGDKTRTAPSPLSADPSPAPESGQRRASAVAGQIRADDRSWHRAAGGAPLSGRRHRTHPPAPVPALLRAQLARQWRPGARPDDAGGLAFPADAGQVRPIGRR
jgi:integrase